MTDETQDNGGSRSLMDRLVHAIGGEPRDRDELLELLRDSQARKLFDADTLQMVEGVFQVVEMRVRDIMIPRGQMKVVDCDDSLEDILKVVIESGHSRFPVIDEERDNVVGVLLAKDLLPFSGDQSPQRFNLKDLMRKATFTPDTKRLNVLLKEFRLERNHMAIVLDEYGGVDGLVTIEDVLEEIVGEIDDEHDSEDSQDDIHIRDQGGGLYMVQALTPIEEFNEMLGTDFSDEEFDTIGGFVAQHIGHMPKEGETTTIDECQFKIVKAESRRVHLIQVTPPARDV